MKPSEIAIIDYGCGNIGSLLNMFRYIGASVRTLDRPQSISETCAVVLPGVGHFGKASEKLAKASFTKFIQEKYDTGNPILGICVGMQLLFEYSTEGNAEGLAIIEGKVIRFNSELFEQRMPIPNVGWRTAAAISEMGNKLLAEIEEENRFYFTHSYHPESTGSPHVTMTSLYGYRFACGVSKGNVVGVQFHPEKSHKFGVKFLSNWLRNLSVQ